MNTAKDVILAIEEVLMVCGGDVEWEISYDPTDKKYTVTVKNLSINV